MSKEPVAPRSRKPRAASRKARPGRSAKHTGRTGPRTHSVRVVVVGASTGGLAAFSALLQGLPSKPEMAFILIQHLELSRRSALVTLLSKTTVMPVIEASNGMDVEPNHVYVIPPNRNMTLDHETLRLAPRDYVIAEQHPIDIFSISLAKEQGRDAIGVILSGTGTDGTLGLKAIQAEGGMTFAQTPRTAQSAEMPASAIAAGAADFVRSPKRIAAELGRIGRLSPAESGNKQDQASRRQIEQELHILRAFVERAPMGIIMLDRQMRCVQASQRWLDNVGMTREGVLGRNHYECLPHLPEAWKEALRRGLAGEELSGYQDKYVGPDGKEAWLNWHVTPWGDSGDRTGGVLLSADNITERILAQAVARQREIEYRALFENMSEGIAYCQMIFEEGKPRDYIYLSVNEAFTAHTGLQNIEGKKMSEVSPDGRQVEPEVLELYGRVALTGMPEKLESYVNRADQWFSISAYSPAKGFFVTILDVITKRKKEELTAQQWKQAFEQSETGISLADVATDTIDAVNSATGRMLGYTPEEMAGRPIAHFYPADEVARRALEFRKADVDVRHWMFESRLLRKDGTNFPALIDVSVIRNGAGEAVSRVNIIHDLTASKRAEAVLRERQQTIQALLDSAAQAILAVNPEGNIVLLNRMAGEMFGYKADELLGHTIDTLIPKGLRRRHATHRRDYFSEPRFRPMGLGRELAGRRKDGTEFPIEVSLSFIEGAGHINDVPAETPLAKLVVAFVSDISRRKQLEQFAQVRAQEVEALAASLITAQEEERRRVSRELHDHVCQQLASLAIDIGGLAADHRGSAKLEREFRGLQARVVKASEETRHIAYQMHPSILDDLGLTASLQDLCKQFSDRDPDIKLRFTGPTLPTSVPSEVASCVYRVAQESLRNVSIHAGAKHVSVKLTRQKRTITLAIADDGAGFEPEAVKGRSGLGLIGMEERARVVNATLTIASQRGRGTRIVLQSPLPSSNL
jgi:PAS domain S-box-containing protein